MDSSGSGLTRRRGAATGLSADGDDNENGRVDVDGGGAVVGA